jgi:predicted O-methyltransferase YrrM
MEVGQNNAKGFYKNKINMKSKIIFKPTLDEIIHGYKNTEEKNDAIHKKFEEETTADSILAAHRNYVEEKKLGFGDPAFHSMWARLLDLAVRRHQRVRLLEIGVFKGQVISLWALLAKIYSWPIEISCITPFKGNPQPKNKIIQKIKTLCSKKYREEAASGNFYKNENYEKIIREHFHHHKLNFEIVRVYQGYSNDSKILKQIKEKKFEIIYVDGDHTFEGAMHDFKSFGPLVISGGWLVADDAGCGLPGKRFWKGHEAVSKAAEILPSLGFRNILNVGHNRIFEKAEK